jgi:hypothetical protein
MVNLDGGRGPGGTSTADKPMALTCYLDDSDHFEDPAITMAGYVASGHSWRLFEERAAKYLREHGVSSVHAMDLENHKREFRGWEPQRRASFLTGLCTILRSHVILGVSVSTYKDAHKKAKERTGLSLNQSPFGWCFAAVQTLLLRDAGLQHRMKTERLSYVIEDGNKHNAGVLLSFEAIKREHNLTQIESMTFAKKNSSIALQMADLLAFYTRRHVTQRERNKQQQVEFAPMLKILTSCGIRYTAQAATDFYA